MDVDDKGSGSKEDDPPPGPSSVTKPLRIKIYPPSFSGPFIVFFRKRDKPINVLLISSRVKWGKSSSGVRASF